jgi:hypothetical protein
MTATALDQLFFLNLRPHQTISLGTSPEILYIEQFVLDHTQTVIVTFDLHIVERYLLIFICPLLFFHGK